MIGRESLLDYDEESSAEKKKYESEGLAAYSLMPMESWIESKHSKLEEKA